jgi:proteasome activator subunit 4
MSLLILLIPAVPYEPPTPQIMPKDILPSIFHMWALVPRSSLYDFQTLDLVANLILDSISSPLVPFDKHGMLTTDQLSIVFSAILRLLEVPVSYVGSPYVSSSETVSLKSDKEKKTRVARPIANVMVYSLCAEKCLEENGIMSWLESLIHAVETFCHPSNQGAWTRNIMQTVSMLVEFFLLRWNIQKSGESVIPNDRHLTDKVKDRFVLALRDVTFLGIHAKSTRIVTSSLEALQGLAYLSPDLIIPRVLNEVYPSLQGLVETHRTMSSLKALTVLSRTIAQNQQYSMHVTTLLGLAIPGIDANDLSKTLHSLAFIQAMALNVPFYDLSEQVGPGLAMEYMAGAVTHLEEHGSLPTVSEEILPSIIRSSTAAFEEFVIMFFGRVFTMLENLPDSSTTKSRDSPEAHVINSLPPAITSVLGAVSPKLFVRIVELVVDFVENNVIHNATDPVAHICGCLVKVNPHVAFGKLFPVLYYNIKQEVEENGAGSTRSSEILPRDRALIWYLSALNVSLAHAGSEILSFKDKILEITLFAREHCKGSIVYHASNAVHHALMTLTTTFVQDAGLVAKGTQVNLNHWGEKVDPKNLNLNWHIPSRPEIEFAVELYRTHCQLSLEALREVTSEQRKLSVTEFSDIVSSNVTYVRTATSGIALLFDPQYEQATTPEGDFDYEASESMEVEEESEQSGDEAVAVEDGTVADEDELDMEGDIVEMKKLREYPVNYFFQKDDLLYKDLHDLRLTIGKALHEIHVYLMKNRDNDIASFKAVLFAYKVWFSDVGFERSSRPLDSVSALYSYESKNYRIAGLRKDFPRPVLARRAYVYHLERLAHNAGPRSMSDLENTLVHDVMKSCISIYPDIRRNGQSSLESGVKVLIRSRQIIYPWALKELKHALQKQEYSKAESALRLIDSKIMQSSVKRDFKNVIKFVDALKLSMQADYPKLNAVASSLYNYFATNLRLPLDVISIDMKPVDGLMPDTDMSGKIAQMKAKKHTRRSQAEQELAALMDHLVAEESQELHWKLIAVNAGIFTAICCSPQMPLDPRVLIRLGNGALSPHPGIKAICMHGLFRITSKLFNLATSNYNYHRFLIDCDEDKLPSPNSVVIDSSGGDFTEKFLKEADEFESPSYYLDKGSTSYGWLVWPASFAAEKPVYENVVKFSPSDEDAVRAFGATITKEWLEKVIARHLEEPRVEDDYFDVTNAIFFKIILRFIGLNLTPVTLDEVVEMVQRTYVADEKNSNRCVAEICASVMDSLKFTEAPDMDKKIKLLVGIFSQVVNESLSHDNLEYWRSFVWWSCVYIDYRRAWPVERLLNEFRLKVGAVASSGFRDSSRISLLRKSISSIGWHYRHDVGAILDNLWDNIAHGLQGVRAEIGRTLAVIYSTRYHESFSSVDEFLKANYESGSVGILCYQMPDELASRIVAAFDRLEVWRHQRDLSERGNSPYILAAKTLSLYLEMLFQKSYAVSLVPLLPNTIIPALLNFLNVRDEQEVMLSAVALFRLLGNIPYPVQYIELMIDMVINVGKTATTWHQRMSILSFIQAFFFRQLFKMDGAQRMALVECVTGMLQDVQLEVRELAAETLAGLIRCSPINEQAMLTTTLQKRCTMMLEETQHWRQLRKTPVTSQPGTPPRSSTPISRLGLSPRPGTPSIEYQNTMIKRHSAVLGLGALVKAFPYQSPPPKWVPGVLTTLAVRAAADPGMVGKSVKATLGDFKKTRQDTWHIDSKVFTQEQLEDLEGVLWKNYFV